QSRPGADPRRFAIAAVGQVGGCTSRGAALSAESASWLATMSWPGSQGCPDVPNPEKRSAMSPAPLIAGATSSMYATKCRMVPGWSASIRPVHGREDGGSALAACRSLARFTLSIQTTLYSSARVARTEGQQTESAEEPSDVDADSIRSR